MEKPRRRRKYKEKSEAKSLTLRGKEGFAGALESVPESVKAQIKESVSEKVRCEIGGGQRSGKKCTRFLRCFRGRLKRAD